MNNELKYFLPYQRRWILDPSPLKIIQKSRQVGISYADAYRSVRMASRKTCRRDIYVSSRDRFQAKLYIEDCKRWAEILREIFLTYQQFAAQDLLPSVQAVLSKYQRWSL